MKNIKRLWTPWRMPFLQAKQQSCVFCQVLQRQEDEQDLIIWRAEHTYVMLNRYPYNTGHLLIIARLHLPSFEDLTPVCRAEMMELATQAMKVLRAVYRPHGFNVGANIGEAAGAGIPGHVHLHVLPRWVGDASFTLTLGETKTLPETLEETWQKVRTAWLVENGHLPHKSS
ncbi:MAG: HIT domain-containing protein [Anaerolineales bacterium]|nr:HIT domain-containing protein [Anaerolineales bacterium]MCX7609206.1 HIT domain-containing protein [Anaerolineales bacterium]MDW8227803.1 HIT domain-containing protein [Anaerolineales bacterium]